jgi:ABC-type transport system involved in cytochrome c biogenesis permease subunit
MNSLRLLFRCLGLVLLALSARAQETRAPWSERTLEIFATLPVQDGGRVKPLDTFAQFSLLRFNGKRTVQTEDGERLTPCGWLLDCLFFPERARGYRTFLVRDERVLEALDVRVAGRKKSDRYSYDELVSGRDKLASEYDRVRMIDEKQRSGFDTQVFALAVNVFEFETLIHGLDFARVLLPTHEAPRLAARFGNEERPGITRFLASAEELRKNYEAETQALPESERDIEHNALEEVSHRLSETIGRSNSFACFPPSNAGDEQWLFVEGAAERAFNGDTEVLAQLADWEALETAKHDPAAFETKLGALHTRVVERAERRGEYAKIPLEVGFYRGDYFTRALVAFLAAFLMLTASWIAPRQRWLAHGTWWLTALGTVLVVVGVVLRCIIRSRPPVSTLYETILFITGCGVIVLLAIEWIQPKRIALAIAPVFGAAGMFLAMKYELKEAVSSHDTMPSLVAVLDTNFWLATHVTSITLGYAAGLLAAILGNLWLIGKMVGLKRGDGDFYRTLNRMLYGVVCFGLFFSVVGTILGGVWANYSWGRFWGWDPKENGALLICLAELLILHARMGGYVRDHGLAALAALNGLCVAFSWWHVNNLGVGLHSYGKTEGVLLALYTYYGIGLAIVGASFVWRLAQREPQPAPNKA